MVSLPASGSTEKDLSSFVAASAFCSQLPVALALEDDASHPLLKGFHISGMVSCVFYPSGVRSSLSIGPDFGCNISKFRHRNNRDEMIHVTLNNFVLLYEFDSASRRPRIGILQVIALQAQ